MSSDWTSILRGVGDAAQIYGAVSGGVGAAQTAQGKIKAYGLLGGIAKQNAAFAGEQASTIAKVGAFRQEQLLLSAGQISAKQKVALAANGVRIASGTATQLALTNQYNRDRGLLAIGQDTTFRIKAAEEQMQSFLTKESLYQTEAANISPTQSGITGFLNSGGTKLIETLGMAALAS